MSKVSVGLWYLWKHRSDGMSNDMNPNPRTLILLIEASIVDLTKNVMDAPTQQNQNSSN